MAGESGKLAVQRVSGGHTEAVDDPVDMPGSGRRPGSGWSAARMLCWREIVRFLRQRNRVVGALGQPIVFWLLFGAGLQQSFRLTASADSPSFLEYYFPGTVMLILLFTAIFATISIIEDRREGFLQSVLVAPAPRWAMVLGKVLGGALIATGQGVLFLLLAFTLNTPVRATMLPATVLLIFLAAVAMTGLGFVIAWRMESTQGFHAIMNLALMPMWLLSGAFFPIPALSPQLAWGQTMMHWIMRLNPLTYAIAGLRSLLFEISTPAGYWTPGLASSWLVTSAFAAVMFAAAWQISRSSVKGDQI